MQRFIGKVNLTKENQSDKFIKIHKSPRLTISSQFMINQKENFVMHQEIEIIARLQLSTWFCYSFVITVKALSYHQIIGAASQLNNEILP